MTALIKNGCLVVANAGDCRAVLSRNGNAESITCDHRPGRQEERERIENLVMTQPNARRIINLFVHSLTGLLIYFWGCGRVVTWIFTGELGEYREP